MTQASALKSTVRWPWLYLLLIAAAELLTSFGPLPAGLLVHGALLVVLTLRGALAPHEGERRVTLALAVAPLLRIVSLTLPLAHVPRAAWYALVAAPPLLAVWVIARQLRLARVELGLRPGSLLPQLMLAGGGLGIGAAQYMLIQPQPLVDAFAWSGAMLLALAALTLSGLAEELIFRGLLQSVAAPALGRWALVYVSLLFATLHVGYRSAAVIALAFGVGLAFAYAARWSGSIVGVTLAHGLANITLFLLMPFLVRQTPGPATIPAYSTIAAGSIFAAAGFVFLMAQVFRLNQGTPGAAVPLGAAPLLRARRRGLGWTYIDLAERTGLPARLLAEIEHGLRPPEPEHVRRICQALGVEPQFLALAV
jgi:uncharacterized protein